MTPMRPDEIAEARRFTRRALLVGAAEVGVLSLLGSKLYDLQVTYARRYGVIAAANRVSEQALAPARGAIRDRFGLLLAESMERLAINIVPEFAGDVAEVLDRLSRIVGVDPAQQARIIELARRQTRLIPIPVATDLSWRDFARVSLLAPELPGIEPAIDWRRTYYRGADVGHVVGTIGKPDRDEIDRDPDLRLPGLSTGKTGVELGMETTLRGGLGEVRREVDAKGRFIRELERTPPRRGRDLVLALDADLQARVLQRMAQEDNGAVVVLGAETGDVLALASTPTYDTARITGGISTEAWRQLVATQGDPLTSKAFRGQYPPGSTFKLVTALAGLEAGVITPRTRITCQGQVTLAGHAFGCWKSGGHGPMRVHDALQQSCDVFFYEVARACGIEQLAAMARICGLGMVYECGLARQKPGLIPDPAWKRGALNAPWVTGETMMAGIGQGFVLATPLQLAVMTARIATGLDIEPRLVRDGLDSPPRDPLELPLRRQWLDVVRAGLLAAVNDGGGTGGNAALPIAGVMMAGKTGTSQVSKLSRGRSKADLPRRLRDHALFVGYAPHDRPRYAIAAIVEHGGGGGQAAAPLARDIMIDVLARDPLGRTPYPELLAASPDPVLRRRGI